MLDFIYYSVSVNFLLKLAQLLAPRTSFSNREVGGSSLTVSTDDPLG